MNKKTNTTKLNKILKKINYKKYHVFYNLFFVIIVSILLITGIYSVISYNADYKLYLTFNNEELSFFNGETLYFNEDVVIDYKDNGYKFKVNNKKIKTGYKLKEGTYNLKFSKYKRKFDIDIIVDYNPKIDVLTLDDKYIHNYLSNNKPFKIVNNTKQKLRVNMFDYENEEINDIGDYSITLGDDSYIINIVDR